MEKYGEIPKKFTKEWWEYFWTYYKWHTIVITILVLSIAVTLFQCTRKVKYDLNITIAGRTLISDENEEAFKDKLSEVILDCDGNGEKNVYVQTINLSSDATDAEYNSAASEKLSVELMAGDSNIFIFTREIANIYLNSDDCGDYFIPVSEWADNMPSEEYLCKSMGVPYAVKLSGSKLLSELGVNADDAYLMIRVERYDEKDKEKLQTKRKSAILAANLLIGE